MRAHRPDVIGSRAWLSALALAAAAVPTSAAPGRAEPAPLVITGYATEDTASSVVDREAPALRTVGVDGVNLHRDGRAVTRPSSDARRLLRRAHADGLRAELLVGNFDSRLDDFSPTIGARLLRHPSRVSAVAAQLAGVVRTQGWDGIAVDLESLREPDGPGLVAFVRALQRRMPADRSVSVALMASTRTARYRDSGYRLSELSRSATRLALMAYDQHGPGWSGPGPVGALPWQRTALAALLARVPERKVDLGVAGYGYSWPEHGTGRAYTVAAARRAVADDGAQAVWHEGAGEWSAELSDGTVLWWSDGRSWDRRADLARGAGVHGMALWRLGSADSLVR